MGALEGDEVLMPLSLTKEEKQQIESFKIPAFISPYPVMRNALIDNVESKCLLWFENQSLHTVFADPKDWNRLMACKLYMIPGYIFMVAEEEELLWGALYTMWLFALDDMLEENEYFQSLGKSDSIFVELMLVIMWAFPDEAAVRDIFSQLVSILPEESREPTMKYADAKLAEARLRPGTGYDAKKIGPIGVSFSDLWMTYVRSTPTDSAIRWGLSNQRYFLGNASEARNRNLQSIPSSADFVILRRKLSAVEPCMVKVDYICKLSPSLPSEVYDTPQMEELLDATNDIVAWHNDIWSFKKELRKGELHNLVFITSRERGCSFSAAAEVVMDKVYSRLRDLAQSFVDLEKITPPEHHHASAMYIKTAKLWVSGTHQFHSTNKRFD